MSDYYIQALRAAGAFVHEEIFTGDYQGTWLALVTYKKRTFFVEAAFGSCSHCDQWESFQEAHGWELSDNQVADFGREYLDNDSYHRFKSELVEKYREMSEWDLESDKVVAWLKGINMDVLHPSQCSDTPLTQSLGDALRGLQIGE